MEAGGGGERAVEAPSRNTALLSCHTGVYWPFDGVKNTAALLSEQPAMAAAVPYLFLRRHPVTLAEGVCVFAL